MRAASRAHGPKAETVPGPADNPGRLSQVLAPMPGIGARTCVRILIDVGDGSAFAGAAHLAAYAGLAPAARASGTCLRGEYPAKRGNKQLKRALYLAALHDVEGPEGVPVVDLRQELAPIHQGR